MLNFFLYFLENSIPIYRKSSCLNIQYVHIWIYFLIEIKSLSNSKKFQVWVLIVYKKMYLKRKIH